MSIEYVNNNPDMLKQWIDKEKKEYEQYYKENLDSLIPLFENELKEMGFDFESTSQTYNFMPKHSKRILPIAIKYYKLAIERRKTNEQIHFIKFFHYKECQEVLPMLIEDFYSIDTTDYTRWFISDCIYQIRSKYFIDEYLNIISNSKFGQNRQMIVLLVGKLKEEIAIPVLINLLEDECVRLHAISALGEFKREEFRPYFERFKDNKHIGWRKTARAALKKLNN